MRPHLRLLGPTNPGLALYLTPGWNDHVALAEVLSERPAVAGVVFHAGLIKRQRDLLGEVLNQRIEAVLDPHVMEQAIPASSKRQAIKDLPWRSLGTPHSSDLASTRGKEMVAQIAEFAISHGFSSIIAPTHFLAKISDSWFDVDLDLAIALRAELDSRGRSDIAIYYRLSIPAAELRSQGNLSIAIAKLQRVQFDGLWLRLHPFGTATSGSVALRGYIRIARNFQVLGVPLVAERTGTVGLALMAFGAVGAIECGITNGEAFNVATLTTAPSESEGGFSPAPRIYLELIGAFLKRRDAKRFFADRTLKTLFACKVPSCCRQGSANTIADPKRHFVLTRAREVHELGAVPGSLRAQYYMESFLRPASDFATKAAAATNTLASPKRRLNSWRVTLGSLLQANPKPRYELPRIGGRVQRGRLGLSKPRTVRRES